MNDQQANDLIIGVIGVLLLVVVIAIGVFLGVDQEACRRTCAPWRVVPGSCNPQNVECLRMDGTTEVLIIQR